MNILDKSLLNSETYWLTRCKKELNLIQAVAAREAEIDVLLKAYKYGATSYEYLLTCINSLIDKNDLFNIKILTDISLKAYEPKMLTPCMHNALDKNNLEIADYFYSKGVGISHMSKAIVKLSDNKKLQNWIIGK